MHNLQQKPAMARGEQPAELLFKNARMVIDPHEYANVPGLDGIRYVLESTKLERISLFA